MSIPELTGDGVLPPGVHTCSADEIGARFGRGSFGSKREQLQASLIELLDILRSSGLVSSVYVDGGFVTDRANPKDIDLIIALRQDHDFTRPIDTMREYMAVDRNRLKKRFGFDILIFAEGSQALGDYIAFFSKPNPEYHQHLADRGVVKGILRVFP